MLYFFSGCLSKMSPLLLPLQCGYHFQRRKLAVLLQQASCYHLLRHNNDQKSRTYYKKQNTFQVPQSCLRQAAWQNAGSDNCKQLLDAAKGLQGWQIVDKRTCWHGTRVGVSTGSKNVVRT
ncbi:ATP-binding cassette sub-family B member 7, mitochondrial [Acipenser oxyrinchus oxyrinchus]|uniref:ATP-binding cassette sub-family B member 7, mitochondrial n=1 Tax=Acipenser oxyrinchus oxyrinchus TaxID=40147 RepID=A0AAD8G444_ACIOX|nr:ATP-binding cassette sub-family B member 7, mitochondrial [Acipenser oxyrinchus oxyrinchus]